ncbi:hypothetical protein B0J14DRAFT_247436 [Halenospora varia]|nr:hypothetical protein B0J14DRAFT_247436 [Halenospora varia]
MSDSPFPSQDGFFNSSMMGFSDGSFDSLSNLWGSQFDVDVDVRSLFAPETKDISQQNNQVVAPASVYNHPQTINHRKSWESIKMGELPDLPKWDMSSLSPPEDDTNETTCSSRNNSTSQSSTPKSSQSQIRSPQNDSDIKLPRKRGRKKKAPKSANEQELARKRFLERNRLAASKCREKKKKWMDELEEKRLSEQKDNARLQETKDNLVHDIGMLRRMVMAHENCPDLGKHGFQDLLKDIKMFGPDMPRTLSHGFDFNGMVGQAVKTNMNDDAGVHGGQI